ncbi:methionyl-tRNA formyltransferase [Megasphaera sp. AM44-1BH]|jgi:methionyl-tRNA formyltransferase|uniref:methionyl-tRNA formyltransferase n=1 Tax=Megasphaera sp. AM44-1BH TaxID=2292358 RepID=UPI000E549EA6|nr:methionyl-tRNA formyltransferase [Megasphaera sp. AM44-1BH]RHA11772.1 methionyl-tRNA formyltransferase [Megasphaera sp. AM44-1BH]
MEPLQIVFMGTPDFSVPSLKAIHAAGFTIRAVYTQPDKQRGRGKKVSASPVKECAEKLGIPVFQPQTLKDPDIIAGLADLKPDVIVVIAYGKILPKAILDIPRYGCLNVHGSLLPAYRGAAPIQYAIKDGVRTSGVTIMMLDEGMDTGKMLKKAEIVLDAKETTGTLFDKLAIVGAETLIPVLKDLPAYEAAAQSQDESKATYTAKITKEMTHIDFSQPAVVIERLIRTLDPHPGAYILHEGHRLKLWAADVVPGTEAEPGTIIEVTKTYITVQTGCDALRIREVQPESRKRMATAQFLQGCHLTVGSML